MKENETKKKQKQARIRVMEQLEQDKKDKLARAQQEKSGGAYEASHQSKPQHVVVPPVQKAYDDATIQIRLPDGTNIRENFKATDHFEKVLQWINNNRQAATTRSRSSFVLVQNFPKKEYKDSDNSKTLAELGLVPSSSLFLKKS